MTNQIWDAMGAFDKSDIYKIGSPKPLFCAFSGRGGSRDFPAQLLHLLSQELRPRVAQGFHLSSRYYKISMSSFKRSQVFINAVTIGSFCCMPNKPYPQKNVAVLI